MKWQAQKPSFWNFSWCVEKLKFLIYVNQSCNSDKYNYFRIWILQQPCFPQLNLEHSMMGTFSRLHLLQTNLKVLKSNQSFTSQNNRFRNEDWRNITNSTATLLGDLNSKIYSLSSLNFKPWILSKVSTNSHQIRLDVNGPTHS